MGSVAQCSRRVKQGDRERLVRWLGREGGADKGVRQGGTLLVPRKSWCPLSEIQGHDPDVLLSPTIEAAYREVLARHRPRHPIALVSLCTSTRPYSMSRKWGEFIRRFGGMADLIVHSNGGVIPIEFEDQFPYLNYDAHGEREYDRLYVKIGIERLSRFFLTHRYRFVLFNFRPTQRNVKIALDIGPRLHEVGALERWALVPDAGLWDRVRAGGLSMKYKLYPDLLPEILSALHDQLTDWVNYDAENA
jgi:hypothetical protein